MLDKYQNPQPSDDPSILQENESAVFEIDYIPSRPQSGSLSLLGMRPSLVVCLI